MAGAGLAVLVNANAKRGGRRVAVQIARGPPGSERAADALHARDRRVAPLLPSPRAVLAAGGDGTAVALLNALAGILPPERPLPTLGVLPLGTGNGWAHALGAPKLYRCLDLLARASGPLPGRRCSLVDVEGTLCHFAGCGYDAMILDDYKRQLASSKGPGRTFSKSVYGYVSATLFRTAPRVAVFGNPHVLVENLGDEVFGVGADGSVHRMEGVGRGAVLYDGLVGITAVGTCPEFGYRFRAFPFAERMPGFMSVRTYDRGALGAVASIPLLWKGQHPLKGMHDWLATHVRMTFSRPVALQIGGDACGHRRTIEYRAADRSVQMVDWRRLQSTAVTP